jgi:hypothetical protein
MLFEHPPSPSSFNGKSNPRLEVVMYVIYRLVGEGATKITKQDLNQALLATTGQKMCNMNQLNGLNCLTRMEGSKPVIYSLKEDISKAPGNYHQLPGTKDFLFPQEPDICCGNNGIGLLRCGVRPDCLMLKDWHNQNPVIPNISKRVEVNTV